MGDDVEDRPADGRAYDDLIREAASAAVEGWDFSWLQGRVDGGDLSWDYAALAKDELSTASCVLDVDTGGGEMLAGLAPLPERTIATEPYAPNIPRAKARLQPMGVDVRPGRGSALPVADGEVDLLLNRHGLLDAGETARVLAPAGVLLTQQVGSRNDVAFNDALGVAPPLAPHSHTLASTVAALRAAGLTVTTAEEEFPVSRYHDVGAVVFQLRAVAWQVPGFDVDAFDERLRTVHAHIGEFGSFAVRSHRFLVRAHKPSRSSTAPSS